MEELGQPVPFHLSVYKSLEIFASPSSHLLHVKQIPSLGAVVLDLLAALLQRLHENVHVFVGLDPHQFLRQVDLKLHIWEHREQRAVLFDFQRTTT